MGGYVRIRQSIQNEAVESFNVFCIKPSKNMEHSKLTVDDTLILFQWNVLCDKATNAFAVRMVLCSKYIMKNEKTEEKQWCFLKAGEYVITIYIQTVENMIRKIIGCVRRVTHNLVYERNAWIGSSHFQWQNLFSAFHVKYISRVGIDNKLITKCFYFPVGNAWRMGFWIDEEKVYGIEIQNSVSAILYTSWNIRSKLMSWV